MPHEQICEIICANKSWTFPVHELQSSLSECPRATQGAATPVTRRRQGAGLGACKCCLVLSQFFSDLCQALCERHFQQEGEQIRIKQKQERNSQHDLTRSGPWNVPDCKRNNSKRRSQAGTQTRPGCKKVTEKKESSTFRRETGCLKVISEA